MCLLLLVVLVVLVPKGQINSCAPSVSQAAGLAAIQTEPSKVVLVQLRKKRDFVLAELLKIADIECVTPEGAFYAMPKVSAYFGASYKDEQGAETTVEDSQGMCLYLLEHFRVALVPGAAFGAPETIRICYCAEMEVLEQAMAALRKAFAELRRA